MRVLILWSDRQSANFGVRVLAEGAALMVRNVFGQDAQVTFQDFSGSETGIPLRRAQLISDVTPWRPSHVRDHLASFDLIWDTGAGDSLTDLYGYGRVARMLWIQRQAMNLGIPYVLGPQTIGPFDSRVVAGLARRNLNSMTAVVARDSISSKFLSSKLKIKETISSTDVVFALPRPTRDEQDRIHLNVSGLLWNSDHVDRDGYRAAVRDLVPALRQRTKDLRLLVHVKDSQHLDNDEAVAKQVSSELDLEVFIPDSLASLRDELATSRLVVGSRMHACLNALSVGTPAIAWAYSRKFAPLLSDVGWTEVIDLRTSDLASISRLTMNAVDRCLGSEASARVEKTCSSAISLVTQSEQILRRRFAA